MVANSEPQVEAHRLTSLSVRNFKSFRKATLELGPLNVIIGANASGKSNLREAFRLLHGVGAGYRLSEIIGERYHAGKLEWSGIRGGPKELGFRDTKKTSLECQYDSRAYGFMSYHLQLCKLLPSYWEVHREELFHQNKVDERLRKIFDSDGRRLQYFHPEGDVDIAEQGQNLGLSYFSNLARVPKPHRYFGILLSEYFQGLRFFEFSLQGLRRPSYPGSAHLGDEGDNLPAVLSRLFENPQQRAAIQSWLEELTPADIRSLRFAEDIDGKLVLRILEGRREMSVQSASEGTLRFLGLLAALFSSYFVFVEDVEQGLHPSRVALVMQLLESRASLGLNQIVLTTHSPVVLRLLNEDLISKTWLAYRTDKGDSKLARISDLPDSRRVLEDENLSILHAEGWLERAASLMGRSR